MDATTISLAALVVAVMAFLFGSGAPMNLVSKVRRSWRARATIESEFDAYLYHSTMFLNGLPHFVRSTWDWGPSVPNYSAAGSFPPETPAVTLQMSTVCLTVREVTRYYTRHSKTAGRPNETLDEALRELKGIDDQYWSSVRTFVRHRWPMRWRVKLRQLRALQIPLTEHDRIRQLGVSRTKRSAG